MKYFLFCCILSAYFIGNAQEKLPAVPLPVELLTGNNRLNLQMLVNKKFAPKTKFGFFSLVSFAADYKNNKANNEFMVPVQLNYEFTKRLSANIGIAMNSNWGFRPSAGLQYTYASRKLVTVVAPSVYLTDAHNIETFALLLYKPNLNTNWKLYNRLQVLYSVNPQTIKHDRSYNYIRVGLTHHSISFGAGANWDWYGPVKIYKENYGLFISADIF